MLGLYVHVPFCKRKCPYCRFHSVEGLELFEAYARALGAEARAWQGRRFDTLFVGGGTPSFAGIEGLSRIFEIVFENFDLGGLREFSVELNPESTSPQLLDFLRSAGVSRVSVGVQSFLDSELRVLGRIHTASQARRALEWALERGFSVNVDLMFGFEGQSLSSWERSLSEAARMGLHHVSTYSFTPRKGPGALPEETVAQMFLLRDEVLGSEGYRRYEISNYAKPGHQCLHNLNYWRGGEYLGLGPSAESFLSQYRWRNRGIYGYLKGLPPARERLTEQQILMEKLFLGIRLSEGVPWSRPVPPELEGLVVLEGGRLKLTQRGVLLADWVSLTLLAEVDGEGRDRDHYQGPVNHQKGLDG